MWGSTAGSSAAAWSVSLTGTSGVACPLSSAHLTTASLRSGLLLSTLDPFPGVEMIDLERHGLIGASTRPRTLPGPPTIAQLLEAPLAADPDRVLLVGRHGRHRTADLDVAVRAAAAVLRGMGVGSGDRVAASLPNDDAIVIAFLGAMRLGAIWVGLNRPLAAPEKAYMLHDAEVSVFLGDRHGGRRDPLVPPRAAGPAADRHRRPRGARTTSGRRRWPAPPATEAGGRSGRRPLRACGHRLHQRHDGVPQGRGPHPAQPVAARSGGGPPGRRCPARARTGGDGCGPAPHHLEPHDPRAARRLPGGRGGGRHGPHRRAWAWPIGSSASR